MIDHLEKKHDRIAQYVAPLNALSEIGNITQRLDELEKNMTEQANHIARLTLLKKSWTWCGVKEEWTKADSVISYDRIADHSTDKRVDPLSKTGKFLNKFKP